MCTHNGARYVEEQLRSIYAQTQQPDELVICDDQSNDQTVQIIKEFAVTTPFPVRLYQNAKRLGVTKNFEKAISLSDGELIFLADQDDVWFPEKVEQISKCFVRNQQSGLVFSDAIVVDQELHDLRYHLWSTMNFGKKQLSRWQKGEAFEILLHYNVVTGATMAFRSSFKKAILPIPECWNHDAWIAFIIAATATLIPLPTLLIQYRQHADNQIGAPKISLREEWGDAVKKVMTGTKQRPADYLLTAKQFSLAEKHFRLSMGNCLDGGRAGQLQQRIRHSLFRAQLSSKMVKRIPAVAKEYARFRYTKFSAGLKSALKDILLGK